MPIRREHIAKDAVEQEDIVKAAVTREKVPKTFIQSGSATLTLPFAAAGVETVSASVTFPTAFPTGGVPKVTYSLKTIQPITHRVSAVSNTGFTIEASDNVGTDLTASVSVDIDWIAITE